MSKVVNQVFCRLDANRKAHEAGVYGEGPRRSKAITLRFTTYPPLTVAKAKCWGTCWADDGISLTTSTELSDPDLKAKVHVDPEPAGLTVDASDLNSDIHASADYRAHLVKVMTQRAVKACA